MVDYEDMDRPGVTKRRLSRECVLTTLILLSLVLLLIAIVVMVIVWWPKQSESHVGHYAHAAVATDSPECSTVGKEILEKSGSATDAAIASLFCVGVRNLQGCGIGGGSLLIVYDSPQAGGNKEIRTYNFREVAPIASSKDMYSDNSSSKIGGLAIAVPGEVKGLYEVWKQSGRLPWEELISPTIKICREGFKMGYALAKHSAENEKMIRENKGLSEFLLNEDGSLKRQGDTVKLPRLAATLERISKDPEDFYSGNMARDVVDDIAEAGGIITLQDLLDYKVVTKPPHISFVRRSNITIYTLPPPSSGPILTFIINLLDGFNLTREDVDGVDKSGLTYHRIIEAFKFGYSMKTYLGDEDFVNVTEVLSNMSSPAFVDYVRSRLSSNRTFPISYYNPQPGENNIADGGTCHLGVMAPDGGAVSATSTINLGFGSTVVGRRTGILFNNEMDDFTIPANFPPETYIYGKENFIQPKKRPLSSMAPSIIFDGNGKLWLSIGGSGGTQITTAVFYMLAHYLWLGFSLGDAVDKARLHNQLLPDIVKHEANFNKEIIKRLKDRGHNMLEFPPKKVLSAVQAVAFECNLKDVVKGSPSKKKCLIAVSDHRRGGRPDGY